MSARLKVNMLAVVLFLDSLGGGELLLIMLFILMFFGSGKIPELAKGLGRGMREFKDAMGGVQRDIEQSMREGEIKKTVTDKTESSKPDPDPNQKPAGTKPRPTENQ